MSGAIELARIERIEWIARDDPRYLEERRLRWEILRAPLGRPVGSEENPAEDRCLHCVAIEDGKVVGCVLALPERDDPGRVKLLQMAVATSHQGRGVGRLLVQELERRMIAGGASEIYMHARESAMGFYLSLGYSPVGERFSEVDLPHFLMQKCVK